MSDYSAWNQLFRLNPDTPQTPMLSSQELQEELALWGNAQFQLEPMNEDQNEAVTKHTSSLSPREFSHQHQQLQQRNSLHGGTPGTSIVSPSMPTDAWGLMSLGQSHQGSSGINLASQSTSQAADPLGFMVSGATSAADFLSAITSQDNNGYQSQQQQAAIVINGVPMLPLMTLPRQQQQQQQLRQVNAAVNSSADATGRQQKHTAIAPAPTFHQPSILPKGGVVASSIFSNGSSSTNQNAKMITKAKPVLPPSSSSYSPSSKRGSNAKQSDEGVEDDEDEDEDEGEGGGEDGERKRTAVADKRRRNTAASARFRVKKKMREQALEQNAREMTAKADALEKRVQELEMETRWLKSLITEKDPSALDKIHCPCHHPNGFEAAELEAAPSLLRSSGRRQQQLAIAPAPGSEEPAHKKAKRL